MDIATIGGIIAGLSVLVVSITLDGQLGMFINIPGVMIVFGGTLASTLVKFPLKTMIQSFKIGIKVAVKNSSSDPMYIYDESIRMAGMVKKGGLLALESVAVDNELFQKGLSMCIDGHSAEVVRSTLDREVISSQQEMDAGETLWRGIGDMAPAWGMIGTLVGLVQMLANLDDPAAIGPAMAIAMLTTFYGAVIANLMAIPLAEKLSIKIEADKHVRELIVESVMQIQQSQNPMVLAEILQPYLPTTVRSAAAASS